MTGLFYARSKRQVNMQFLLVVLLVHLIISKLGEIRQKKITMANSINYGSGIHPAEFLLR